MKQQDLGPTRQWDRGSTRLAVVADDVVVSPASMHEEAKDDGSQRVGSLHVQY